MARKRMQINGKTNLGRHRDSFIPKPSTPKDSCLETALHPLLNRLTTNWRGYMNEFFRCQPFFLRIGPAARRSTCEHLHLRSVGSLIGRQYAKCLVSPRTKGVSANRGGAW